MLLLPGTHLITSHSNSRLEVHFDYSLSISFLGEYESPSTVICADHATIKFKGIVTVSKLSFISCVLAIKYFKEISISDVSITNGMIIVAELVDRGIPNPYYSYYGSDSLNQQCSFQRNKYKISTSIFQNSNICVQWS